MATNVHRYFRCMGHWSHSARSTVRQVNFSYPFCLRGSNIVFAAEPFVDKVFGCSRVDHCVDRDLSFRAVESYLDHNMVVLEVQCFRVVQCCLKVPHLNGLWFGPHPQTIAYWGHWSFPDSSPTSFSTSISRALAGGLHRFLLSLQGSHVTPSLLLAWPRHAVARCPGLAHLRHKFPFILRWYSLAEILNPGLLRVASNSIGSYGLSFCSRKVPFWFLGVPGDVVLSLGVTPCPRCLMAAILGSFLMAQFATNCGSCESDPSIPQASCGSGLNPLISW